jgi:DNA repair protein RecO (recombination protein O)
VPRPRVQQTEAIVLREQDYSEADRILTLLTPAGKVTVLARGVRKPTSRKAGHLGLFHRSQVMLAQGRNMDLVTQAVALDVYEGLWHDLLRFTYACYAAELVDRFVPEHEGTPGIYDLLGTALGWFSTGDDLRLWARYLELSLLQQTGYLPSLYQCVVCGAQLQPESNRFDVSQGGMVCARCGTSLQGARPVTLAAQKVLRYLSTHDASEVGQLAIHEATHREIESLMQAYLQYTLERELKSTVFLRRLRSELEMHEALRQRPSPDVQANAEV